MNTQDQKFNSTWALGHVLYLAPDRSLSMVQFVPLTLLIIIMVLACIEVVEYTAGSPFYILHLCPRQI